LGQHDDVPAVGGAAPQLEPATQELLDRYLAQRGAPTLLLYEVLRCADVTFHDLRVPGRVRLDALDQTLQAAQALAQLWGLLSPDWVPWETRA
jgi:hypothetical protein